MLGSSNDNIEIEPILFGNLIEHILLADIISASLFSSFGLVCNGKNLLRLSVSVRKRNGSLSTADRPA